MEIKSPSNPEEFKAYYDLRWRILRKPWGEPPGAEKDALEDSTFHFMALDNEQVIAVSRLDPQNSDLIQLRFMAVDDTYQAKGIGKKMLQHAEQFARTQGYKKLILEARENAVGFYENSGYSITKKSYLLFDSIQHWTMEKDL